ncbi:MAG: zinc-finger domain-containing protein [Pseudomonadota bacterium]|nr:zinc-finger domain-containing protein [Pseudomonadota bacterium]
MTKVTEIIEVDRTSVACDGGAGPLGHPRVFLHMGEDDSVTCPYCSRHFVLRKQTSDHAA